jgi:hypothetical protein
VCSIATLLSAMVSLSFDYGVWNGVFFLWRFGILKGEDGEGIIMVDMAGGPASKYAYA